VRLPRRTRIDGGGKKESERINKKRTQSHNVHKPTGKRFLRFRRVSDTLPGTIFIQTRATACNRVNYTTSLIIGGISSKTRDPWTSQVPGRFDDVTFRCEREREFVFFVFVRNSRGAKVSSRGGFTDFRRSDKNDNSFRYSNNPKRTALKKTTEERLKEEHKRSI